MKKVLSFFLCAALLLGGLAGCSGSDAGGGSQGSSGTSSADTGEAGTGGEVVLQFWKAAIDETRNEWWVETLARFEEEHPGIKVEFLGVPGDPADFDQKLDMSIAGNDSPDIISSYLETAYIGRGLLEPLDSYYSAWENKDSIPEKYLSTYYAMDYASDVPRLYATPAGGNVECFYVRPDILKAHGFEAINTWGDFFEAAEQSTDAGQGIYGYIIRGGPGSATALGTQMYSYSGITDYFIDGVCTINDPLNIEYAQRFFGGFGTYTSEEDVTKGWTEMAAQFQSGKAAMMIHNLGSAQSNYEAFQSDTDQVLAIPYPVSQTGARVLPSARPAGNMMMASSQHKDEAWTLLQWLIDVRQDSDYHELMANLPFNTESLQQSWIQDVSYMKMGADMMNDSNTALCVVPYYLPNYSNILSTYVEPGIQSVLLGQMSAEELLNGWAELLQADYDALMG